MQSPMSPISKHHQMYQNTRGRTPPWKENFRKKCLDRVRGSRARLVEKFRNSGAETTGTAEETAQQLALHLMEGEWGGPLDQSIRSGSEEEQAALLAILEEVQEEMRLYGEQLAEDVLRFEQASVEQLVSRSLSSEVICPVCQVGALQQQQQQQQVIVGCCQCGLTLAGVTLKAVEESLQQAVGLHSSNCCHPLSFSVTSVPASSNEGAPPVMCSNVLATCGHCDWMSFII